MEMFCTHLNYKQNRSIFFRFNCACVVKPLAGQTEQTWHSSDGAVKTEDKTVRVWVPLEPLGGKSNSNSVATCDEVDHVETLTADAVYSIASVCLQCDRGLMA
jgi:hypothetical protein